MRILGERSLVSMLKIIVDIAYFIALGVAGLMILMVVLVAVFRPGGVSLELPARFDVDPAVLEVSPAGGDGPSASIVDALGEVTFTGMTLQHALLGFAVGLLVLVAAVFILGQFRGLFRTLKARTPFVQANVRRIRVLGLTVIAGEIVRAAVISWSSSQLARGFVSEGIRFRADFEPSELVIFSGLMLLVLAEVFREAAQMKRDLETAREIQFELVPSEEFRKDDVTVRSRMRPANTVGGDYYDVIPLDEDRIAVVQGDVSGKGLPAALLMAVLQGSLRTLISAGFRGARLVEALNNYLNDNTPSNRMVTMFYGELDTVNGELRYVNAGHNVPVVMRRDGTLDRPAAASMVLGILPARTYEEVALRLEPGERLLLFTDGVSEASDEKEAEYGDGRVADYLQRHASASDEDLVGGLVEDVLAHTRPARPGDDMTLTLISRAGARLPGP